MMKRFIAYISGALAWFLTLSLAKLLYIVFIHTPVTVLNYFVFGYVVSIIPCFIVIWVFNWIDKSITVSLIHKFIGGITIIATVVGVLNPFKPSDVPYMVVTGLGTLLSVYVLSQIKVLKFERD